MIERHKTPRESPIYQRPPRAKGWARCRDGDATLWRIWAPTIGGTGVMHTSVLVTDLSIALAGRVIVAMKLKAARKALKLAIGA